MTNIQSKIDLLKQRAIDLEVENAKLKQIIKENAKRKADNVNLSAENAKVKIELRRAMGENAKLKAESLREVKTRERIEKTMLELDGIYVKNNKLLAITLLVICIKVTFHKPNIMNTLLLPPCTSSANLLSYMISDKNKII
ncbi:hypothetical protein Glove_174g87 [Diversispora epigaea]|uniref:Uncharacterized protein n=1 Tax=Diversispora epigaea TaxID=1348612 RepID=A0A397IXM2_9GLOM|nr:hypothetical protein Glove_174g87 [Diversispora epigaea]